MTSQILFQPLNPSWFFTCRQVGLVSMVHVFDLIRNIKLNKNINKFSLEFIWYMSVSIIAANHYIRPEEEISLEATKVTDITWNNWNAVELKWSWSRTPRLIDLINLFWEQTNSSWSQCPVLRYSCSYASSYQIQVIRWF